MVLAFARTVCRYAHRLASSMAQHKEWSVTLNTGAHMPALGLGTWLSRPGEVEVAVEAALSAGYRHIDTAHMYQNETAIGDTLQRRFRGGVTRRKDIFVTSKLWNTDHENVLPACQLTLKNLQLDYLDLYLIHWPCSFRAGADVTSLTEEEKLGYDPARIAQTWQAMEELVARGLVRAIGISNFTITKTERLLQTAKMVPAVNQVECHPYFQQHKLKEYCHSKGIVLEAYAPLGRPAQSARSGKPVLLEDPAIKQLTVKHGASPAQICISHPLHRGIIVIPKSSNPMRIEENYAATRIQLDTEDLRQLSELERGYRIVRPSWSVKEGQLLDAFWDIGSDSNFSLRDIIKQDEDL